MCIRDRYVDASFAVHPDYRSHTGAVMTFGKGSPIGLSKKQKLNTRSSTEAELVGADDAATMILIPDCLWRNKVIGLKRISFIRIIKVLFYWKRTAEEAQVSVQGH